MIIHTILIRKDPEGEVAVFNLSCAQEANRIYGFKAEHADNGGMDSYCPCDWTRAEYEKTQELASDSSLFVWASCMMEFAFRQIGEDCNILRELPQSFDWKKRLSL